MQNRAWVTENSHKHDTDQTSNVLATTLGSEPLTKLQQLIDDLYSHHKPWLRGSNAFNADNRCPPSSRSHMQQSKRPRFVDTHGSAPGLLVRLRINSYQHRLLKLDSQAQNGQLNHWLAPRKIHRKSTTRPRSQLWPALTNSKRTHSL